MARPCLHHHLLGGVPAMLVEQTFRPAFGAWVNVASELARAAAGRGRFPPLGPPPSAA